MKGILLNKKNYFNKKNNQIQKLITGVFGVILIFIAGNLQAQLVANYTFAQSTNTYTAVSSPTTVFNSGWDDNVAAVAIPFTFTFNGSNYTSCNVNSNGYLTFGTTAPSSTNYTPIATTDGYAGVVCAFARDLVNNSSTVVSGISGGIPNRIFIIQWNSARRYSGSAISGDVLNFQIRLYETSNKVEVMYGTNSATSTSNIQGEVGLGGASIADFDNRTGGNNTAWASLSAGLNNTDNVNFKSTVLPSSGLTFTWTPPLPPILTSLGSSNGCPGTSITINGTNLLSATSVTIGGTLATITSNTSTQIIATIGNGTTGNVVVTNGNGTSNGLSFTVNPGTPATPGAITGATAVCAGSVQSYSILSVTNATSYAWTVPTGWTINSGQGSVSISLTAGSSGQNGNISVAAVNPCGNSSVTQTINIPPTIGTNNTGYTDNTNKISGDINVNVAPNELRGYLKFPLSSIPSTATISSSTLSLTNNGSTTLSGATNDVKPLANNDPTGSITGSALFAAIGAQGSGTNYSSTTWSNIGTIALGLNSTANSDIQARLAAPGYIAMGLARNGTAVYTFYGYTAGLNAPLLTVTYNTGIRNLAVIVSAQPTVSAPSPATQTVCSNGTIGGISTTASGGTGTFSYQWFSNTTNSTSGGTNLGSANGAQTATYTPPATATVGTTYYYVTISQTGAGCGPVTSATTASVTVTANNTAVSPSSNPSLCLNTALSPNITIATTGATGIGTATGLPSGVTAAWGSNTITISGTPTESGSFSYSIPLTGGCGSINATGTITVNALPTSSVTNQTNPNCFAGSDGTITIAASGGSGTGYSYSVDNGASWAGPFPSPYTYPGLPANTPFQIRVMDSNGCQSKQVH